jgi:hypothetical protein
MQNTPARLGEGASVLLGGKAAPYPKTKDAATIEQVARDVLAKLSRPRITGTLRPRWPA